MSSAATLAAMHLLRLFVLALAVVALPAFAQWQWIDKDGRKVFSDKAPPPEVPANKIVKRPGSRSAAASEAAPVAAAPASGAAPKVSGKDKELEDKKKQAQAAADEKKKADDAEREKLRADSCQRLKRSKATIDSGERIVQTNEKGEREYLDDAQRAAEGKRLDAAMARDCKPAG